MQKTLGLALVALQAALMGLLSQSVPFPLFVVLLAGFGALTPWRISLSREQAFLLSAGAAFFFLLEERFSPQQFPVGAEFIRTQVAFLIAKFLLLIEAAQFIIRREDDALSPVLPALGAVALICIADIQITNEQRPITQAFAIAYPLLWGLYLWSCRKPMAVPPAADPVHEARRARAGRRRHLAAGLTLGLIAATAWASSSGLYVFERSLERWLVGMIEGSDHYSQVGFSRSARLGSIAQKKSESEQEIALWVYADGFPGYLRGAVFTQFESSEWFAPGSLPGTEIDQADESPPALRPIGDREFLYSYPFEPDLRAETWRYCECWRADSALHEAFAPLGTTHLISTADRMGILPYGVFWLYDPVAGSPYTACVPTPGPAEKMPENQKVRWLFVPEGYRPALREIAERIFTNAKTDQEKIAAIERYFAENYQYHLGIEIPPGQDPLLFFLREKPAAHCEFFASAAALLLRMGDVPTRYVTGFVPGEWNPSGQYWIARNRDAHAWVEAYVEGIGWVTVEATPGEGLPSTAPVTTRRAWWETLKSDWRRLRAYLSQNQLRRAGALLSSSWLGGFAGLFGLAFLGYLAVRVPWPRRFRRRRSKALDPQLARMQRLLEQMDHRLRRHGLERKPGETLHRFARRIRDWNQWQPQLADASRFAQEAGDWYLAYADARYQGQWDEETLDALRSSLPRPV